MNEQQNKPSTPAVPVVDDDADRLAALGLGPAIERSTPRKEGPALWGGTPEHAPGLHRLETAIASGARSAVQSVDSYVRVYPWGALAASAVLGLAVGLLFSRG
ncbi:hypothetical protein [Caldimonas brevitalea]|uniref:hypothetical protein n=1 Tax=Caldimonas brevitalea TaxID=413882 RepID=UPI0012FAAF93|nr:hypothetical protein [Caldimonas brevitalea]